MFDYLAIAYDEISDTQSYSQFNDFFSLSTFEFPNFPVGKTNMIKKKKNSQTTDPSVRVGGCRHHVAAWHAGIACLGAGLRLPSSSHDMSSTQ